MLPYPCVSPECAALFSSWFPSPAPLCIHSLFLSFLPSHTQSILHWIARGIPIKARSVPAPQPPTMAPSSRTVRNSVLPITLMVLIICPIILLPSSLPAVTGWVPGTLLPQGLCTGSAFCLAHSSPRTPAWLPHHQVFTWFHPLGAFPDQPVCTCNINPFP